MEQKRIEKSIIGKETLIVQGYPIIDGEASHRYVVADRASYDLLTPGEAISASVRQSWYYSKGKYYPHPYVTWPFRVLAPRAP